MKMMMDIMQMRNLLHLLHRQVDIERHIERFAATEPPIVRLIVRIIARLVAAER
jgi:hypothetical protein